MKFSLKILLSCIIFVNSLGVVWAKSTISSSQENNYFQFVIPYYHTTRQSGQDLSIYVRYAYRDNLPQDQYFDYRTAREEVLKFMEPSEEFPADVYWEFLAQAIGKELMKKYPLKGVSIQLEVSDNQDKNSFEPGDHGPIYTLGQIEPLAVIH